MLTTRWQIGVIVIAATLVCGALVWIALYTASQVRQKEREACAASTSSKNRDDKRGNRNQLLTYSIQVSGSKVSSSDRRISVIANCGAIKSSIVPATIRSDNILDMTLVHASDSNRLWSDITNGRVVYMILRGVIVRAWASSSDSSIITIAPLNDVTMLPNGCSPLPIGTPFGTSSESELATGWKSLVSGLVRSTPASPVLLQVWAF
jgi:hypothetical protein